MSVWESREARLEGFKTLEDGWFGPGSVAPKHFILDAIAEAFTQVDWNAAGHWAFGPYDGGVTFEHRETRLDSALKAFVTRDTDVHVFPVDDETFKIAASLNEYIFDESAFMRNKTSLTKTDPYKELCSTEHAFEGTAENIVLALERKLGGSKR